MAGLEITKDGATFVVEPLGNVTQNTAVVGTWKTNEKNQVVLTKADGTKISFDVEWKFNADNHLVMSAAGKEFDFHSLITNRVVYSINEGILIVKPAKGHPFKFEVTGKWDITENHDLSLTINNKTSVIDGNVRDTRGRFFFVFIDKSVTGSTISSTLQFAGEWKDEKKDDGKIFLKFLYKQRGSTDVKTFSLPKEATFNKAMNQLMYEYKKANNSHTIQFFGTLFINENFQISYALNRQTEGGKEMTKSTTFSFDAIYVKDNFSGNLEMAIKKSDGKASNTVFVIGGDFTALVAGATVKAGFSYHQVKEDGGKTARAFGFNAEIVHKNGKFQIEFLTENAAKKTISLDLGAEIQVGPFDAKAKLSVKKEDGQFVSVTFLLGVFI